MLAKGIKPCTHAFGATLLAELGRPAFGARQPSLECICKGGVLYWCGPGLCLGLSFTLRHWLWCWLEFQHELVQSMMNLLNAGRPGNNLVLMRPHTGLQGLEGPKTTAPIISLLAW